MSMSNGCLLASGSWNTMVDETKPLLSGSLPSAEEKDITQMTQQGLQPGKAPGAELPQNLQTLQT